MTSEQLFYDKKPAFDRAGAQAVSAYAEGYKAFLDRAKTERDAVKEMSARAERAGFVPYRRGQALKPGDRIYQVNRAKGITLAVIGEKSLAEGVHLTAAHLDAPRIDIRTLPLYETENMAFFKTHYYGGIKKYQWTAIPLELRGVVCVCENGEIRKVEVSIGADPSEPKLVITDLLPHLASEQMQKKMTEGIKGEGLNVLVGSRPAEDQDEKSPVKLAVMRWLNEKYGMKEADFLSAELSCVPAFNACDIGLDRSFIGGYGHDDRCCSYPAATALMELEGTPSHTCVCLQIGRASCRERV